MPPESGGWGSEQAYIRRHIIELNFEKPALVQTSLPLQRGYYELYFLECQSIYLMVFCLQLQTTIVCDVQQFTISFAAISKPITMSLPPSIQVMPILGANVIP